jgi:predicted anti-sigma-YlaC factor YlaD
MKRKVYTTRRERMIDQIIGFLAFPLVNVPLGIVLWTISERIDSQLLAALVSALPWLVNGIVLVLAVLLRPEFAIGYVTFIGAAVAVVTALSVVVVAACFVIIPLAPILGDLVNWVFIFLIGAGLLGLGVFAIYVFQSWQSSSKNNSH